MLCLQQHRGLIYIDHSCNRVDLLAPPSGDDIAAALPVTLLTSVEQPSPEEEEEDRYFFVDAAWVTHAWRGSPGDTGEIPAITTTRSIWRKPTKVPGQHVIPSHDGTVGVDPAGTRSNMPSVFDGGSANH